ncbi:cytochrome P450 [Streptomyces fulvoviolaceus]|uniref:cytochrome P450 n=1 Tax=Streptomyces fulvoviolaceus TaxID=285535 RepID=UPI0004C9899F|nr:cytochrome P450 [Streptomyces fulvoviolaceus]MCT9075604.1 cytochrome P450 [Streptomyces fulvoviolaceus]
MSTTLEPDGTHDGVPAYPFDNRLGGPVLSHHERWDEMAGTHSGFRSTVARGFWVVTDGPAVQQALQDWQTFSNKSVTALEPDPKFLWIPEMLDPPVHTVWRRLLGRYFSPNTVAAREPEVREVAAGLIDALKEHDGADVLDEFARRFPTLIFMRLMGLPEEDLPIFLDWVHELLHLSHGEDPEGKRQMAAMLAVSAYFEEQIALRRKSPRDDLLSHAMTWTIDGEAISDRDMHAFCILLFQAGFDTVPISIGWALYHFATHPEQRAEILADPSLIPTAVEETLRVYSFVVPARKATKDVEVGGCPVKAGEMVMLPLAVTNRDPERYDNPLEVDLHRKATNHIAFGSGPHRCLGSHLARLELNVAVEEWHRRIPDYRIAPGQELWQHGNMYGIKSLRLEW